MRNRCGWKFESTNEDVPLGARLRSRWILSELDGHTTAPLLGRSIHEIICDDLAKAEFHADDRLAGRVLVVLEGIDGAGTTTQASRITTWLRDMGIPTHLTRQPSDHAIGRQIRAFLGTAAKEAPSLATMALLFAADRLEHQRREVVPALERGDVVVSDRWVHSSIAYQADESLSVDWVRTLNQFARKPDLTLVLDVPPELAEARRRADGRTVELYDALEKQRRVAARYAVMERLMNVSGVVDPSVVHVDGSLPLDDVTVAIMTAVIRRIRLGPRPTVQICENCDQPTEEGMPFCSTDCAADMARRSPAEDDI